MKLLKIKAQGFKSFADKIEINVEDGITGIVGPNGSGKSNIVDAIRWVLGEQSIKALRGSDGMTDVIFSGSKSREAHNRCYVSLTFSNKDHYLKSEYEEIEIKRVLYKTGENDYFINNVRVRLKDIINLFLDSGASKESFNIISQGNVKDVINFKPDDRKAIFESAAGVLTYKKRKEETTKKIMKTNDNIERLELLINELKKTLDPLEEDAEKALKYEKLYEELKEKEIAILTLDIENLNDLYHDTLTKIENIKNKIVEFQVKNSDSFTKLESLKLKQIKLDDDISLLNDDIIKLNKEISELKSEKQITIERQKYEVDDIELENIIINLKENKLKIESNIIQIENEIKKLRGNIKEYTENKNNQLKKLDSEITKINQNKNELFLIEKNINLTKNKIEILNSNIENNSSAPYSVKEVLKNKNLKGIHSTISNLIETDSKYLNAINIALGAANNFLVVDNEISANVAIEYLKKIKGGRATFFPLNIIKKKNIDSFILDKIKNIDGFIDVAANLVKYKLQYENIIYNQLGNVIVCNNLKNAHVISKIIDYKLRVVTLDGEIIHQGGFISGGSFKNSSSIIYDKQIIEEEKRKLKDLLKEKETEEKLFLNSENNEQLLRKELANIDSEIVKLNSELSQKNEFLDESKNKLIDIENELKRTISSKNNDVNSYLDKIMENYYNLLNKIKNKNMKLEDLKNLRSNIIMEISELEKDIAKENSNYSKLQQDEKKYEIDLSKYEIKLDNCLNILSEEYCLTFEKAKKDYSIDIDVEKSRAEIINLKNAIKKLGNVNLSSIDQRNKIKERYNFLKMQKDDLVNSISNLESIISEMDEIMKDKLFTTFEKIRLEFKDIFKGIFKGGKGDLILTNPNDILNTGIDIIAEPPGKKVSSIGLLSGGEKTLTAIALLFAIINVKTVPFCILDEVEESLDESNVDIFGKYLQSKKNQSQFIIITHKKRTMEYTDVLYGITMQESGVSKIVSVKLDNID